MDFMAEILKPPPHAEQDGVSVPLVQRCRSPDLVECAFAPQRIQGLSRPGLYAGHPGSSSDEIDGHGPMPAYTIRDTSRMTVLSGAMSLQTRVSLGTVR